MPPGYSQGVPAALVLNFHGYDETAEQQERLSGMSAAADRDGYIVAYPEGLGSPPRWNSGRGRNGQDDQAFVRALIDALSKSLTIDPNRVYATGISNGGGMVNRLGCEMADKLAAIAPVSGDYQGYQICSPSRPVSVVAFHGTADRLIPYNGNGLALPAIPTWAAAWAARDGCGANAASASVAKDVTSQTWSGCKAGVAVVLYTIDGGGHTWPGAAIEVQAGRPAGKIDGDAIIWAFFRAHPMP